MEGFLRMLGRRQELLVATGPQIPLKAGRQRALLQELMGKGRPVNRGLKQRAVRPHPRQREAVISRHDVAYLVQRRADWKRDVK